MKKQIDELVYKEFEENIKNASKITSKQRQIKVIFPKYWEEDIKLCLKK